MRISVTLWAMAVCLLAAGCSTNSPGTGQGQVDGAKSEPLRIAVLPKSTNHEHWNAVRAGAIRAGEELGVEILWDGPQVESDTQSQINLVKNFITKRVDGICLAPAHSQSLVDVVVEANDEGIPVVIFDSGLGAGAQFVSYVATDNFNGGRLAAKQLAEALGEKGNVILLRYMTGSESTEQREAGFLEAITDYPDIQLLSSDQYAEATTETALRKAQALLLKYQDKVDGFFAVNESSSNGALEALEQTGLAGKVTFVAFDPSERLIDGLRSGKVAGIILQDPVNMGYQSVKAIVDHIKGREVPATVPTGEHVATRENMTTSPIDKLLDPL